MERSKTQGTRSIQKICNAGVTRWIQGTLQMAAGIQAGIRGLFFPKNRP